MAVIGKSGAILHRNTGSSPVLTAKNHLLEDSSIDKKQTYIVVSINSTSCCRFIVKSLSRQKKN